MRRYRIEFDTGTSVGTIAQFARGIGDAINKIELKFDAMPEIQRVTLVRVDGEPPQEAPGSPQADPPPDCWHSCCGGDLLREKGV